MPVLAGAWYPKPNKTLILPDRAGPSSFHPHPVKLEHIGGMLPGLKLRQMAWFLSVGPAEYPSFARCTRSLDGFGYCLFLLAYIEPRKHSLRLSDAASALDVRLSGHTLGLGLDLFPCRYLGPSALQKIFRLPSASGAVKSLQVFHPVLRIVTGHCIVQIHDLQNSLQWLDTHRPCSRQESLTSTVYEAAIAISPRIKTPTPPCEIVDSKTLLPHVTV